MRETGPLGNATGSRDRAVSGVRQVYRGSMNVAQLRLDLLRALYDEARAQTTSELCRAIGTGEAGWSEEEVKHALDGLADAGLVRWEARGEHAWVLTPRGQDYLAANQ